jgi:hypothetical protein
MRTVIAIVLVSLAPVAQERFLVKDGQPMAQIIVTEQPPRMTRLAAEELRDYVQKISGAELPITTTPADGAVNVYVGRSAHTDRLGIMDKGLDYGAYRVVSGPDWLVLLGHDSDFTPPQPFKTTYNDHDRVLKEWDALTRDKWLFPHTLLFKKRSKSLGWWDYDRRGSLNAVYGYLRSLGVRWYMQGDLGEIVPKQTTIALPRIDQTVRPDFAVREFGPYSPVWIGDPKESILWRLRMGLNAGDEHLGLSASRWLGHGICLAHGREETKRDHPEYFVLYNGKRFTGGKHSKYGKPCLSSPELFAANVRFIQDFFRVYPDEPMVSVMPADGYVRLCECPLCKGKDDPERGPKGFLADYVWDYVNRVAIEIGKTNPGKKIVCFAYGPYLLPPKRLTKLSPNLAVGFCQHRAMYHDPEMKKMYLDARQGWLDRLTSGELYLWEYYLYSRPGRTYEGVPVFFPHAISEDLKLLKGKAIGEGVEQSRAHGTGIHAPGFNHLNAYITSRLYWDADQDVDAMLAEYYRLFYGPAADQMKGFIEYSEAHWHEMLDNPKPITQALSLLDAAQKAAGDTVYGQRIALLADYVAPLRQLQNRLELDRTNVPACRALSATAKQITVDGKLDEPCWQGISTYPLRELETGRRPFFHTTFRMLWTGDALYVGITCQDFPNRPLNIATRESDSMGIWDGDNVEILLETQNHCYYQIAVNPAGAVTDADREQDIDTRWSANAECATHVGESGWTVEIRLPLAKEGKPGGIQGRMPSETYPWFLNVCRQRVRPTGTELSAFSPTGKPTFHDRLKFAVLTTRP